jgi:protein arginine kinase
LSEDTVDLHPNTPWSGEDGPSGSVVLSSRVRLARNITGYPFVNRSTPHQCEAIIRMVREVLLSPRVAKGMMWVDLSEATRLDRGLLVERHLISKHHAESDARRAVAISGDESLSVMVNEEDHLRMQMLRAGLQLSEIYAELDAIDDHVEQSIEYAFHSRWGYLTACPTNVGTGIRFSVMLHLPALKMIHEIERVRRAAKDLHLAVRGFYGEGSESAGDFYQVSNQVTLGRTEQDLLAEFNDVVLPRIIAYEDQARQILLDRSELVLDDRSHRALAILRAARLLSTEEAMKLLSRVRLGATLHRLEGLEITTINRLFLQIQPAHLQLHAGRELDSDTLRSERARIVREALQ